MASSSPSTWICHSPKLETSHFCLPSLYFKESMMTRRRIRRLMLLPKCSSSLHEDSPVVSSSRLIEEIENKKKNNKEEVGIDSAPGSSIAMEAVEKRRTPIVCWKRIFFASRKVRSVILLNILTVIYASDIPVLKEVEQIIDPAFFTVVRFAVTAIPFIPVVIQARDDCQTRSAGIELGLWISLGYLCQALGLLTSEAGHASFISAVTIIVVPLIDGIFGATVPALTWTGAMASLTGVGILECGGTAPCVGDILNIMSAVFFGVHMYRTEQISRSIKRVKFLALLGYQVSVVALSSAIWFVCKDMFSELHQLSFGSGPWEWSSWWDWMISFPWIPAIYTGIFSTGLCLWAEMDAMRDVSATEAAIIYGVEPVWGAAFAWLLLGERWDTTEWFGAVLVLCGSLTVQILGSSPEESSKKARDRSNRSRSIASDDQNDLSLLTVVVKTKKNDDELFRKQDKL